MVICASLAVEQQIAFKNLVQRNQANEASSHSPPPSGSVIQLPFIILNTDVRTVIDCSISSDKYEISLHVHFVSLLLLIVCLQPFICNVAMPHFINPLKCLNNRPNNAIKAMLYN